MNEDKPYNLPPALLVADMCSQQAWEHDIDDVVDGSDAQ